MTGLGWNGSYLYGSSTYSSYAGCYKFNFSGSSFTSKGTYINDYSENPAGYDISYRSSNGSIWMATDNATSPVACFEDFTGGMLEMLPASIGIGSDCRGLAFESGSSIYLWVSNIDTDEIYRVELTEVGIEEESTAGQSGEILLECSLNPFSSSVILQSDYTPPGSTLDIYDLSGRSILRTEFNGYYLWAAEAAPSGTYVARISGDHGSSGTLLLTKLKD